MSPKLLSSLIALTCLSFASAQVFELQENNPSNNSSHSNNSVTVTPVTDHAVINAGNEIEEDEVIVDKSSQEIVIRAPVVHRVDKWVSIVQKYGRDYYAIEQALQNGQNANQAIFDGSNMLHLAAWQNDDKLFRLGLQYGALLINTNKNGETALHWAGYSNNPSIINMALSDKSALKIINKQNKSGRTALHFNALKWGNIEVAKALIAQKADLNIQDNNGQTPLHYAISLRKWALVKLYIESGADVSIKDKSGDGIDEYIMDRADIDGLKLLYKYLNTQNQDIIKSRLGPRLMSTVL